MIMLICVGGDCSLTHTRRAVGMVAFHSKGPMMGQYVFLMVKKHMCIHTLNFNYYSGNIAYYFLQILLT